MSGWTAGAVNRVREQRLAARARHATNATALKMAREMPTEECPACLGRGAPDAVDCERCGGTALVLSGYRLVIPGKPVVAKNRRRIMRGKGGKPFIGRSAEYEAWHRAAVAVLQLQWGGRPPLVGPLNAAVVSYLGARQRPDLDNLYGGPLDALQAAGVLSNDYQVEGHDGSRRRRDAARPRVEITLTRLG